MNDFYLPAIRIRGFRSFRDVLFRFNRLEVIVGANGSGKSALFEFLRFLRDSCERDIPAELMTDIGGRKVFHKPGPNRFFWNAQIDFRNKFPILYQGEIEGGVGSVRVLFERILTKMPIGGKNQGGFSYLDFREGKGLVRDPEDGDFIRKEWDLRAPNRLGLGAMTDGNLTTLYGLREYIRGWRFYNGTAISTPKIRRPVPVTQHPILEEDAGNLSAVLFDLMTEHSEAFEDLKSLIQFAIPGFKSLDVRAQGRTGEVLAFWKEDGGDKELSIADLSDGILRFIAWATLCVTPYPPTLICIDNPVQGLHPRTLPVLAGLFEKAAERTQVLLATHESYFMTQFDLENIAILKKSGGGSVYVNIRNAQALLSRLRNAEPAEIEQMYRVDELEAMF